MSDMQGVHSKALLTVWLIFLALWVWTEISENGQREERWTRIETFLENHCSEDRRQD